MVGIWFLLAVMLGGAAFAFYLAADQPTYGTAWASDVCSLSKMFCHNPEYLAYAAGGVLVIAIGAKIGSLTN